VAATGAPEVAEDAPTIDEGIRWDFSRELTAAFERRTRQWTSEAITSAAQQDPQQPDP
ncbi:hypothetical protein Tco_0477862, partial [Tanacetum coccineum]